jgi:hypothetical protein
MVIVGMFFSGQVNFEFCQRGGVDMIDDRN